MTGIYCHDGIRHYPPEQVEAFGADRLLTQANRNVCGPHRLKKEHGMKALVEDKIKAIAGAIVAGIVTYVGTAIIAGTALTAHGLELAAVGAAATFLGVHQAPANKAKKRRRSHPADVGLSPIDAVVLVFVLLLCCALLVILLGHIHH